MTEMRDNPNITAEELRKILGISKTAVDNNISFLRENGYIERAGSKKAGYWNGKLLQELPRYNLDRIFYKLPDFRKLV